MIQSLQVFALVRYPDDPQRFSIEYTNGLTRKYTSTERWALYREMKHFCYLSLLLSLSICFSLSLFPSLPLSRDALLCSILDGVRASGNRDICVKMHRTTRGHRLGPLNLPVEEEVESQYLKYLVNTPPRESCDLARSTVDVEIFALNNFSFSRCLAVYNYSRMRAHCLEVVVGNRPQVTQQCHHWTSFLTLYYKIFLCI